jgi:hypothetical protein
MIGTLTAQEQAAVRQGVAKLETFMVQDVAKAMAARLVYFRVLADAAQQVGASDLLAQMLGPSVLQANAIASQNAAKFIALRRGLDAGDLVLVAWSEGGEQQPGPLQLGIVKRETQPQTLGQWQVVLPAVVRVAGQAALAIGSWVLVNAWTTAHELSAQAEKTRADTASKMTSAVAQLAKTDPDRAQQLAAVLSQAQSAANAATPGLLDQLIGSVRDITGGVHELARGAGSAAESGLLLLGLLWYLSKRKKNPRLRSFAA